MQELILKIIITLISIVYAVDFLDYKTLALVVLIGLAISLIIDFMNKKISIVLYLLFFFVSIFYPFLIYAYPIVIQASAKIDKTKAYSMIVPVICLVIIRDMNLFILLTGLLAYVSTLYAIKFTIYKEKLYEKDDDYKIKLDRQRTEEEKLIIEKEKDIEIAILSERNRISREIHDSVGHTISGAIIQTEAMRSPENSVLNRQIDALQDNLKKGMADIRTSLHSLHDKSIDLELAINDIIKNNPSLDFTLNYKVDTEFTYQVKHNIISVVKEAVSNTLKHSNSKKINISIIELPKHLSFSIEDKNSSINDEIHNELSQNKIVEKGIGFVSFEDFAKTYNGRFTYDFNNGLNLMFLLKKESLV